MVQFSVSIGQHEYRSEDGGMSWMRRLREVPARNAPLVRGDLDLNRLPPQFEDNYWDLVTLLPCGFGVAVGHQTVDGNNRLANIFVTADGGQLWRQKEPKPSLPILHSIGPVAPSWPVERFESLALPAPGWISLAWDDHWLFDGSQSHVICSRDRGESWEYHCLGYTNPYLALDYRGGLLALNDGFYLESSDGGTTWGRRDFQVDWPEAYNDRRVALLRQVTFVGAEVGYALVVHWTSGPKREMPPNVGLLATNDNGSRWKHLHVFAGPNVGDVNERHVLELRVASKK